MIVPVRNQPEQLAVCLNALLRLGISPGAIVVVDDASVDGTPGVAKALGVRLIGREHRGGPAAARNSGVAAAPREADILLFVDADVVVAPGTIERLVAAFADPVVGAVFGSYDAEPAAEGIVSRYRNLLHHFVHQSADPEASTFWAGCGAVRRTPFLQVGGFDEAAHWHFVEDIELGHRLRRAGWRIRLDKELQAKHLKRWTVASMTRTDLIYRARPWSRLLLEAAELPDALNVNRRQRLSVALSGVGGAGLIVAVAYPAAVLPTAAALIAVALLDAPLFRFLQRAGGLRFAAACFPLHVLHHLCAGLGFGWAWVERRLGGAGPRGLGDSSRPKPASGPGRRRPGATQAPLRAMPGREPR